MRSFWHNLFQPAEKARPEEKNVAASTPQPPAPQASAPKFKPYPPARRQRVFATDTAGQHLQSLWSSVLSRRETPLEHNPDFLPFALALTRACQLNKVTSAKDEETKLGNSMPPTAPAPQPSPYSYSAYWISTKVASTPRGQALGGNLRGIPPDVVRGLAEVVLSVPICSRCGRRLTEITPEGCLEHGLEQTTSWRSVLPLSEEGDGGYGDSAVEPFPVAGAAGAVVGNCTGQEESHGVAKVNELSSQRSDDKEGAVGGEKSVADRRACLVGTLHAISAVSRWLHTREELARGVRCGGGDLAKGLCLLLNALCAHMVELRRTWEQRVTSRLAGRSETDSAVYEEVRFFLRCLVPLAKIVSNSAPAAAAWYALVNDHAVPGTGVPRHPWPQGAGEEDILPGCSEFDADYYISVSTTEKNGSEALGLNGGRTAEGQKYSKAGKEYDAAEQGAFLSGGVDGGDNEVEFVAMLSVADSDEWSAALLRAGMVQSLVYSLQACVDVCLLPGLAGEGGREKHNGPSTDNRRIEFDAQASERRRSNARCLRCWCQEAEVEVVVAIGGLLSAHPLASRDRLQLANGTLAFQRVIASPTWDCRTDFECLSFNGIGAHPQAQNADVSTDMSSRFVHAHCCLVVLEVLRLYVRAGDPNRVSCDVVNSAARVIEALPHAMRSLWDRYTVVRSHDDVRFHPTSLLRQGRVHLEDENERQSGSDEENYEPVPRATSGRYSLLSREFLPLRCPSEVELQRSGNSKALPTEDARSTSAQSEFSQHDPSYLLCRPRAHSSEESVGAPLPGFNSNEAGWEADGLQQYARTLGPGAAALVSALHDRLEATLNEADIVEAGQSVAAAISAHGSNSVRNGFDDNTACREGERRVSSGPDRACPAKVLMGFYGRVLNVVADCSVRRGPRKKGRTGDRGRTDDAGVHVVTRNADGAPPWHDPLEVVLRCAISCFADVVASRDVTNLEGRGHENDGSDNERGDESSSSRTLVNDSLPIRTLRTSSDTELVNLFPARSGGQTRDSGVAAVTRRDSSPAYPFRQLLALRYLCAVMRRWPRLTIRLFREIDVWDMLFSQQFLGGCSTAVMRAVEIQEEYSGCAAPAAVGGIVSDSRDIHYEIRRGTVHDVAIGWGLVHDAILVLLETVATAGQLLRARELAKVQRSHGIDILKMQGHDRHVDASDEPREVGQYLRFLKTGKNTRISAVVMVQGCKWLRNVFTAEATFSGGLTLLSPALHGAALRLAFELGNRSQVGDSGTRVSKVATWPLLHACFSLAMDLVSADAVGEEGVLFDAAVAFSVGGETAGTHVMAGLKVPRVHRPTASLTSDASTHGLQTLGASWTAESVGSSGTAASENTESPHVRSIFSFGEIQLSQPQLPSPLAEVLFKAALNPNLRRAAFYITTRLGVEAGRVGLAARDKVIDHYATSGQRSRAHGAAGANWKAEDVWTMRETAAEILSGLVEGYLCLCERAAAVIAAAATTGPEDTGGGVGLLVDALRQASSLLCAKESSVHLATDAAGRRGTRGERTNVSTHATRKKSELSPLLQEAFREHRASARLLVVLERVAERLAVDKTTEPRLSFELVGRYSEAVRSCLSFFTHLMTDNSYGKRAFRTAIASHSRSHTSVSADTLNTAGAEAYRAELTATAGSFLGQRSFAALAPLVRVVPASLLLRALMEMLMDGEVPVGILRPAETDENHGVRGVDPGFEDRGSTPADSKSEGREPVDAACPPEIRNPLVVPLVFGLLPDWPILEQRRAMEAFLVLLSGTGGGMANRSMCCDVQPPLIDQLLDMLPHLDEGSESDDDDDGVQSLAIEVVRQLGSHSITVAQLKKIFRLMQPLPASKVEAMQGGGKPLVAGAVSAASASVAAPLQPRWLCGLLRALRGMMEDRPGPQRFFLLDGLSSGLRLPPMSRWPAPKGYTFCAWVKLEATLAPHSASGQTSLSGAGQHAPPAAGAPCLFSFCGERGQGVAACFIPLRKGRGRERAAAAAASNPPTPRTSVETQQKPQQYALELRVGAGRKKTPTVVRFPGVVVSAEKWVFVAVAHAPSSWGHRGEAAVLADNCWRVTSSPFPRFRDGGVPVAGVACHCPLRKEEDPAKIDGAGAKIAGKPVLCSLRGQMGPIYLFSGNLSEEMLRGIRQLGPGYAFSFEPPQIDSREIALLRSRDSYLRALSEEVGTTVASGEAPGGASSTGALQAETGAGTAAAVAAAAKARQRLHEAALSGVLTPLILLAYNSSVWGGEYFLDNTPDGNNVRWTEGSNPSSAESRGGGRMTSGDTSTRGGSVIYSMSGSQAHVFVQPRRAASTARGDDGKRGEPRIPDLNSRERGWSGMSSEHAVYMNTDSSTMGGSTTHVRPRPRPGCMHAMRLQGTRECVTRDVRDALDCLGGVKVLLPLFAQYDHGVLRAGGRVTYQTDPRLNETVLALLAGTLRDSVPNRRFLRRHDGLALIYHCLERVSPQHMTPGALTQACRLTDRLGSWSEDWADSAIAFLLAPSRLWVFAPPDAQLTLAGVLRGLARRCPGRMRRVIGVQRCLDALDLYYWHSPPAQDRAYVDDTLRPTNVTGKRRGSRNEGDTGGGGTGAGGSKGWSYVSRQWLNPSTGELLGRKASGAALREIRARLFDAVALMACDGDGVGRADVAAVLGFLHSCRDDSSRCEALRLVLRLMVDSRQAARFAVASGYVAIASSGSDKDPDDGPLSDSPGSGPGRGGTAIAIFLSLLRASDATVRLLALLALAQLLIACLRIEDRSSPIDDWRDVDDSGRHTSPVNGSNDETAPSRSTSELGSASSGFEPTIAPSTAVVVGFMGGTDAKAEELAVLTGAAVGRDEQTNGSASTRETGRHAQMNGEYVGGVEGVLELRGGSWEHIGLPRNRVLDVLLWAQRQVARAFGHNAGKSNFNASGASDALNGSGVGPRSCPLRGNGTLENKAAAERTVARVTLGVLQGLLVGELPRGFVTSVVSLSDRQEWQERHAYTSPVVAPPLDVILDPFFLDTPVLAGHGGSGSRPPSRRYHGQTAGDGSGVGNPGAGRHPRTRPSWPGRNGGSTARENGKPEGTTLVPLPLLIRLPEAFPALCQQVATAPEGAAPRDAVIETLVASAHDVRSTTAILSVDSWQQYLLSIVSSAQGRQAMSAAVAAAAPTSTSTASYTGFSGPSFPLGEKSSRTSAASATVTSDNMGRSDLDNERSARIEAGEEDRLIDLTVRLICWLAMCEVRQGKPGRPGAGFTAFYDTMSFLRCQAELGAMECVSVGERVLRHMMSLLKREADALESEVNGWARVSHHPSLRSTLGAGGNQGAAAVLACVWPLAALVVEFIAIPPVPNPPAAAACGAPTPAAAALAIITAVADDDQDSQSRWSDDSLTCPSPMQGILQWLDTGMKVPTQTPVVPPSPSSPTAQAAAAATAEATTPAFPLLRMGSSSLPAAAAMSAAGWRAWELLDAAVDLVGPTGDTLLWDAKYRHDLAVGAGADTGVIPIFGAIDSAASKALDWGRRELDSPGRDDGRTPRTPSAPRKFGGGFIGGARGGGAAAAAACAWFVDAKGKRNPLADAGGVPWMLVRLLLAVFVGGGAAAGHSEGRYSYSASRSSGRGSFVSTSSAASSSSSSVGGGKGGGGGGSGPPSIALFALQRLIALLNSLEASGYKCYEFEVLHVAARVATALRLTRLTPQSAWVLGALQLLAKCLAAQAAQIEDLLVAAEDRIDVKTTKRNATRSPSLPTTSPVLADESSSPPRSRLIFRRRSQPSGWWIWSLLSGAGGGPTSRRHSTPKGVLHQIAAETPSLATFPTADLALEFIRRTLGIELPSGYGRDGRSERGAHSRGKQEASSTAAPLTWDLLEAAFEPISEEGAGHEASGLQIRLDVGGMHAHALQVLGRVRALEGRGLEAEIRVPASVVARTSAVTKMEAERVMILTETEKRASNRRQAQWEAVLKQLATERGPWGRGVEAANLNSVYWMLNPREDDCGRRLKLIQNPHGCRHTIASERTRGVRRSSSSSSRSIYRRSHRWGWRSTVSQPGTRFEQAGSVGATGGGEVFGERGDEQIVSLDSKQPSGQELEDLTSRGDVRAISAQTSLWQDLCKYRYKSVKVGDKDGEMWEDEEEEESEEEEDEETDDEHYSVDDEGRTGVDGGDGGQDGPRKGRRGNEVAEGAVSQTQATFSTSADVVRPFHITPGMVSLIGDRLVFTRSFGAGASCADGTEDSHDSSARDGGDRSQDDQMMTDNYRWALKPAPNTSWPTSGLRRVLFRPHGGLRFAALELWFKGGMFEDSGSSAGGAEGCSLLLGLPSEALARTLHQELKRTRPPALGPFLGRLPATVVSRSKAGTWGASGAGGVGTAGGPGASGNGAAAGMGRATATAASAAREAARTPLTQAWVRRRCGVTNFDYLRGLNVAAGRTTADLTRYPVFPWVLSERAWRAQELDLTDERNFRDLAWPMGAQRPEQREALHMKYEDMEQSYLEMQRMGGEMADLALPPFHHGSHYSSSAYVLWYLMRLEPFTSLHIHLQDGRFDKPDRLFRSLPEAYSSCTKNPSDVKEAIPELYYLPEMLVNGTGLDLGRPQCSGKPLSDVELPPWAHGDPWEFIRRHREALESEHVSLRLHKWIDLVFGSRQRPPALSRGGRGAVESCNVFFHLTYPGAVDLPRLRTQDPQLYESTMKQIEEFGQAPAQLFSSPHPPRLSILRAEVVRPLASPVPGANTFPALDSRSTLADIQGSALLVEPAADVETDGNKGRRSATRSSYGVVSYPRERVSLGAVLVVYDLLPWAERVVTVDARRAIGYHGWQAYSPEMSPPFRLRVDTASIEASVRRHGGSNANSVAVGGGGSGQGVSRRLGVPFVPDGAVSSRLLEPPPSGGGNGGGVSDGRGDSRASSPALGGLSGSCASLASMGSLLSLSHSAPAAESLSFHVRCSLPHSSTSSAVSSPVALSHGWSRRHENGIPMEGSTTAAQSAGVGARSNTAGEGRARGSGFTGTTDAVGGVGGLRLGSHMFAVHAECGLLFSGGHWDSSFRVTSLDTGRLVVSVARHRDVVTSLWLADGGFGCRRLVTASRDTTLMVWDVDPWGEPPVSASSLLHVLYGHDTPVTCVCASASLDTIVSSGEDGTLVVHNLWSGEYTRTITPRLNPSATAVARTDLTENGTQDETISSSDATVSSGDAHGKEASDGAAITGREEVDAVGGMRGPRSAQASADKPRARLSSPWPPLEWVGLSAAGYIVSYSSADAMLRSYSINGHSLGTAGISYTSGPLHAFVFSEDGSVLLSGGNDRVVTLRWAHNLEHAVDGGREGCGAAVLTGAASPLPGVPGAAAGVDRFGSAVRCLALTAGERHLLVGLEDGKMGVLALDARYLRQRLRSKLDQLGF